MSLHYNHKNHVTYHNFVVSNRPQRGKYACLVVKHCLEAPLPTLFQRRLLSTIFKVNKGSSKLREFGSMIASKVLGSTSRCEFKPVVVGTDPKTCRCQLKMLHWQYA